MYQDLNKKTKLLLYNKLLCRLFDEHIYMVDFVVGEGGGGGSVLEFTNYIVRFKYNFNFNLKKKKSRFAPALLIMTKVLALLNLYEFSK